MAESLNIVWIKKILIHLLIFFKTYHSSILHISANLSILQLQSFLPSKCLLSNVNTSKSYILQIPFPFSTIFLLPVELIRTRKSIPQNKISILGSLFWRTVWNWSCSLTYDIFHRDYFKLWQNALKFFKNITKNRMNNLRNQKRFISIKSVILELVCVCVFMG